MLKLTDSFIFAATNAVFYAKNARLIRHYHWHIGRLPNIANPNSYAERMLWRKLADHNPLFVVFSDKLASKEFSRQRCPDLSIPRTLWVGDSADEIPEGLLRQDVFVKANHGCDFNYPIRAAQCDRADLRKTTDRWLHSVYGVRNQEWAYSQVTPKLFVEESVDDTEKNLTEFNIRASNGKPILGSVIGKCKTPAQWVVYFDPEGMPTRGMTDADDSPIKPLLRDLAVSEPYRQAVQFTKQLSIGVDYARFDFMWNGKDLFGGEITVYPAGGNAHSANAQVNACILEGWDISQSHFVKSQQRGWKRLYTGALKRQWARHAQ